VTSPCVPRVCSCMFRTSSASCSSARQQRLVQASHHRARLEYISSAATSDAARVMEPVAPGLHTRNLGAGRRPPQRREPAAPLAGRNTSRRLNSGVPSSLEDLRGSEVNLSRCGGELFTDSVAQEDSSRRRCGDVRFRQAARYDPHMVGWRQALRTAHALIQFPPVEGRLGSPFDKDVCAMTV
jgi:hypothetical protein